LISEPFVPRRLRRSTVLFGTSIASPFFMTAPRQVLPGTTYLITRRCSQRQFLLRPSDVTNSIFLYVLALAAKRFGVEVHAFSSADGQIRPVMDG
jgi:hypothetical protein